MLDNGYKVTLSHLVTFYNFRFTAVQVASLQNIEQNYQRTFS